LQDEITALREASVDAAYNFYAEAANGLAEHAFEILESHKPRQIEEKKK
jgi:hypothetical protein